MPELRFEKATLTYPGNDRPAVNAFDLTVKDGEFLVLVGPSGCGKTIALRTVAGLEDVDSGSIFIGDRDVTDLPPKTRNVAMVLENYALYTHMTVAQNMEFALRIVHMSKDEIARRVARAAEMLDLTEYLERRPAALSGGHRQRVAMGRAIVREPRAFLMDEPLSNLDAKLRVQTRTQIADLQHRLEITMLYVTHGQVEAMMMGDRVAVLRDGILQQIDAHQVIYAAPVNSFVAGFVGSPPMNLLTLTYTADGQLVLGNTSIILPPLIRKAAESANLNAIVVGIRPERWQPCAEEEGVKIEVLVVEELGSHSYVHGTAEIEGAKVPNTARHREVPIPRKGSTIRLAPSPRELHFSSAASGERLGP